LGVQSPLEHRNFFRTKLIAQCHLSYVCLSVLPFLLGECVLYHEMCYFFSSICTKMRLTDRLDSWIEANDKQVEDVKRTDGMEGKGGRTNGNAIDGAVQR